MIVDIENVFKVSSLFNSTIIWVVSKTKVDDLLEIIIGSLTEGNI